jgi:hypothetical protein
MRAHWGRRASARAGQTGDAEARRLWNEGLAFDVDTMLDYRELGLFGIVSLGVWMSRDRMATQVVTAAVLFTDLVGAPVVEAARLCASAEGGQVLLPELARMMIGRRGDYMFKDVGKLELKGLPARVAVCELLWEPLAAAAHCRTRHGRYWPLR